MSVTSSCPTFSSIYFSIIFPQVSLGNPITFRQREPVDSMEHLLIKHSEIDFNAKMRGNHDNSRMLYCL